MERLWNPCSPGAGSPPPELVGRDALRGDIAISIGRLRLGRYSKSVLLVGLRGVGKTVLLDQLRVDAERDGVLAVRAESDRIGDYPGKKRTGDSIIANKHAVVTR